MPERTASSATLPPRPVTERARARIFLLAERCKGCAFCVEFCPKHVLVMSDRFNAKGYHIPLVVAEADCTDCKLCQLLCPEFAIYVVKEGQALS
jgi:2-oxoglutarate ferredoxin oxidoreductase subunit delta